MATFASTVREPGACNTLFQGVYGGLVSRFTRNARLADHFYDQVFG